MPITEISSAIASAKTLAGMAQTVFNITKEYDKAELRSQILALIAGQEKLVSDLLEAKIKVMELESQLSLREAMHFIDGVYWKDAERKDGPYCPACWHATKEAVPMRRNTGEGIISYDCVIDRRHSIGQTQGMPAGGWHQS